MTIVIEKCRSDLCINPVWILFKREEAEKLVETTALTREFFEYMNGDPKVLCFHNEHEACPFITGCGLCSIWDMRPESCRAIEADLPMLMEITTKIEPLEHLDRIGPWNKGAFDSGKIS